MSAVEKPLRVVRCPFCGGLHRINETRIDGLVIVPCPKVPGDKFELVPAALKIEEVT